MTIATPIAKMVREMIARGVDPDIIELAVSTAEQTSHYVEIPQNSADVSAEKRRARDRERKRISKGIPQNSAETPQNSQNASISTELKKESKRQNRGTRIAADWSPSDAERSFANQEGFSDWEIQREGQKFRDYWIACAGSKGVKLDWAATWRQWIRSGADRAGKTPAPSSSPSNSIDWDAILTSYKKFGHWSRFAGPDPDSPACQCPREMLEKYGFVSDSPPLLRAMQ